MATIDGIEFQLENYPVSAPIKNTRFGPPGTDVNPNTDLGGGGLLIRVSGAEYTREKYDEVVGTFLTPGSHELYVETDGNPGYVYIVHRASMTTNKPVGYNHSNGQKRYPYTIDCITEDMYVVSSAEKTRSKTITSDGQQWAADDSAVDILTSGNVEAKPSIIVTSSETSAVLVSQKTLFS